MLSRKKNAPDYEMSCEAACVDLLVAASWELYLKARTFLWIYCYQMISTVT